MSKVYLVFFIFYLYITNSEVNSRFTSNGMGTVLFAASDIHKQCWSPEEIAILTTRMILEDLLPKVKILNIDSDEYVNDIVEYFRLLINAVRKMSCGRKKHITMMALTDLLGGYLHHAVLPITREAYYAGILDYTSMEKLIQLYEELKWFLRTNGQGWSVPMNTNNDFEVQTIDFRTESPRCNKSCCRNLIYYKHEPSRKRRTLNEPTPRCYFFPIPFLDSKVRPSAIAVPFKRYSLRNIESKKAAYLVMKYFVSVEKCFKDLHMDDSTMNRFHNNMFTWIEKQVMPKLKDDKFYSAFGGILRVEETLKSLGAKVNAERSLTEEEEEGDEEVGAVPGGESASRSSMVLMAMLIIIFIWFIIGTLFICYRMKANAKGKSCAGPKSDGTCSGSTGQSSRWSILSRSSSRKSTTTCKCCSKTVSDKTECKCSSTPTIKSTEGSSVPSSEESNGALAKQGVSFDACVCDGYAVIDTKHSMKVLPSIPELSETSSLKKTNSKTKKITFDQPLEICSREDISARGSKRRVCSQDLTNVRLVTCPHSDKATSASSSKSRSSEGQQRACVEGEVSDETVVTANSPHIYACHSSLTGNYTADQRYPLEKPYIFGYDFQTSSSSADVSDEDTDGKTVKPKFRLDD